MKDYSYSLRDSILTYRNWYEVMKSKPTFFGRNTEKFPLKKKMADYIKSGLDFTCPTIESDNFNEETLLSNPLDMPMSIEDLKI